jgi:KDO2-lipid IV(A) lauroyltransferase
MEGWTRDELLARVDFQGLDALRRAVESGEGAVVLTGHLGNWELAGAALAASGIPLDVVGKGMSNRGFEAELVATRARLGMRVIDVGDAPKRVLRALGEGRAVAMLVDQNAHRSKVFVPFFGKRAATARGPALLALRTGAPIFLGAALRTPGAGGRYAISMDAVDFHPTGDLESDVLSLSTEFARLLEAAVRAAPEQYFWQHKRWKTRPPEEPAPGA